MMQGSLKQLPLVYLYLQGCVILQIFWIKTANEKEKRKNIKKLSGKLWDQLNQFNGVELVLDKKYLNGIVSFNIENIEDKDEFVKKLGEKKFGLEFQKIQNGLEHAYIK